MEHFGTIGISIVEKVIYSGKGFFRVFFFFFNGSCSLKGSLGSPKWFFYVISKPSFRTFIFKSDAQSQFFFSNHQFRLQAQNQPQMESVDI